MLVLRFPPHSRFPAPANTANILLSSSTFSPEHNQQHGSLQSAILDSKTLRLTMEQKLDLCIKITAAYEKLRHDFKVRDSQWLSVDSQKL